MINRASPIRKLVETSRSGVIRSVYRRLELPGLYGAPHSGQVPTDGRPFSRYPHPLHCGVVLIGLGNPPGSLAGSSVDSGVPHSGQAAPLTRPFNE